MDRAAAIKGTWLRQAARELCFGNWSYGIFAVALGIEAALQQQVALNGLLYHVIIFLGTVAFYNRAYIGHGDRNGDERAQWNARHERFQRGIQWVILVVLTLCCAWALWSTWDRLVGVSLQQAALFAVFPLGAAAYYGNGSIGLRRIGWLKPFVLGFVWAGVVTVYPILVRTVLDGQPVPDLGISARLFFKNMMFCAMIGVLFDIKDHADDHRSRLRTFVVQGGLRTTLFRIVLPLTLLGLATFLWYGALHGFSAMKLLLNTIPFAAMIAVIYALRRRRSILFYLIVVDGLLLVKAICGSAAMRWF